MNETIDTKEEFSLLKRGRSFVHAWRGVTVFLKTTHNAWLQAGLLLVAVILGLYWEISSVEWMILTLSAGLVFAAEAVNTAIEIDIDLTSPDYHPYARDTKDVAAGAVLIASATALIVGALIFVPRII